MIAGLNLAFEKLERQRVRKQLLDRALQRPRAIRRVVAFLEQRFSRRRREFQRDPAVGQVLAQRLELDVDDLCDLFLAKTLERDDVFECFLCI